MIFALSATGFVTSISALARPFSGGIITTHAAELKKEIENMLAKSNKDGLSACDLETPLTALAPKRLHLLRYVRRHEVLNVRALAASLRRDYKNAHKDAEELTRLGLLCPNPEKVLAPHAEIGARSVV